MSPAKKPVKKTDQKKQEEKDRPLSEKELRKVSGGAEPVNTLKRPPRPIDPING